MRLTTADHDRAAAERTYVYPVVSRRAGGLSIGINLNPNKACNWRCVYCQVPGLVRGSAPPIDLARLREELHGFLAEVVEGDFMERRVPEGARRLNDLAFSGDGEPTSSRRFADALAAVAEARARWRLDAAKTVLITNGSLVHKPWVLPSLGALARENGEIWFKLDRATARGLSHVNSAGDPARQAANLRLAAERCPTWVQTCLFARGGTPPEEAEMEAYLAALAELAREEVPVEGVLLYGLARPSHQPEAPELAPLPAAWMEEAAERIRATGLACRLSL